MSNQAKMADESILTNHDKQNELTIPASPNWYCSTNAACNGNGLYGFSARSGIFVFDISGRIPVCKDVYQYHKDRVTSFCWPICKNASAILLASGSEDGWVKVFSTSEKKVIGEHKKHQAKVTAIDVLQDGCIVSGDDKGVLALLDYETETVSTWLPVPSSITSIAACLQKQSLLAVGYANGHVLVGDIRSRVIIQQFKSHSDEVQSVVWQPLLNEDLHSHNDRGQQNDGLLLASGSKDKSIRVWNTQKESPVLSMNLPTRNSGQKGRRKMDEMNRAKIWLSLCWYKRDCIISSSVSGELLAWDLKTKDHIVIAPAHSRMIFSICYDRSTNKMMTTSMDRQIMFWDADTYSLQSTLPSLGGYVYSLSSSYLDPHSIIYGVGDNLIRVWNTRFEERPYDMSILWQGIKSKVTVVECHPSKESLIGFGTDDGHVGVYNVASGKFEVSISYHKKTVYSISWGPHCGDSSDCHSSDANWLYSLGGEGTVLIHSMNNLQNKARDMNAIIKKTNSMKEKLPSRSDIEWKGDGKLIAVGNDDGSIEIFGSPDLRHICTILVHRKIINCMKWHHHFDIPNGGTEAAYSNWLASGSSDNYVCVTDITAAIDEHRCSLKSTTIKEKFRHFNLHSQRITCLSWSPHTLGLLSSSSYDGTVQVWNCVKDEQIANFRGHSGRVLSILWSFIDPDVICSGGEDFTLRKWSIASCKETSPPANKKQSGAATTKYVKTKSPSTKPPINESLDSGSAITNCVAQGNNVVDAGNATPSVNENDARLSTVIETQSREDERRTSADNQRNEKPKLTAAATSKRSTTKESKKKKAKSLFPLTSSQNHKQKTASQQECVLLAQFLQGSSNEYQATPQNPFEPGTEEFVNLGLFGDRTAAFKMFATEGKNHGTSGNLEQQLHLELWKGNLGNALNICKEKGELNEMVVAMSPLGGFEVWQATMCAFADQLASKGDCHTAATYYVASNNVYKAIEMFKAQNMIKEAIALAKVRLSSEDPALIDLYQSWGEKQNAEGCYENAAKCYIAAGDHETAIKILARKGDVSSLKTAAEVALIYNDREKADLYLKQCAETLLCDMKWKELRDVVNMMSNKMGFTMLGIVHEVLMQFLRGTECDLSLNISSNLDCNACFTIPMKTQESSDADEPCPSSQPTQLLQIVCNIFFAEFKTLPSGKIIHEMSVVENKLTQSNAANIDLKRVIVSISNHIMKGITSLQDGKSEDCVSSWIQALDICYRSCQFEMLELLYNLLFPRNFYTLETLTRSNAYAKHHEDIECKDVRDLYRNCQSFQYVSMLYQFWWKRFPEMIFKAHMAKEGDSDASKRGSDPLETELCMSRPDVMINPSGHQRNQFCCPPRYDLKNITVAQFVAFISGLCAVLLSSNHARKDQLTRRVKELDQQLLEARIKKQLRQHIKDRAEQLNKTQTNKNKKSSQVYEAEKHSVHDSNWRVTEIKDTQRKEESDSTEYDQTKVQRDNQKPNGANGSEISAGGTNTNEINILGHEIDVIDDQSMELMKKENEILKKELQLLVSQILDTPFVDSLESAKIILHVISQTLKSGLLQDIVASEKLNQIAKDIIEWASTCALMEDDKGYFEQYESRKTVKLIK